MRREGSPWHGLGVVIVGGSCLVVVIRRKVA